MLCGIGITVAASCASRHQTDPGSATPTYSTHAAEPPLPGLNINSVRAGALAAIPGSHVIDQSSPDNPGAFKVQAGSDEAIMPFVEAAGAPHDGVVDVYCGDEGIASGAITPVIAFCMNLPITGTDPQRLRQWWTTTAKRAIEPGGHGAILRFNGLDWDAGRIDKEVSLTVSAVPSPVSTTHSASV